MNASDRTVTVGDIMDTLSARDSAYDHALYVECHGADPSKSEAEVERLDAVLEGYRSSHPAQYQAAFNRRYRRPSDYSEEWRHIPIRDL